MDDRELDRSLRDWANADQGGPEFLAQLKEISAQQGQERRSMFARALKSVGGWGFAAPQLAGLVLAAWLGVSSGSAAYGDEDSDVQEVMSAHIFGDTDYLEG